MILRLDNAQQFYYYYDWIGCITWRNLRRNLIKTGIEWIIHEWHIDYCIKWAKIDEKIETKLAKKKILRNSRHLLIELVVFCYI